MAETKGSKRDPLVAHVNGNTKQPIRQGDGITDVLVKTQAQNKYILTGRDKTRKPGQTRGIGAESMHEYHQADIVRKTALGELAAQRIIEGGGIAGSLKDAFKDKMAARAIGVKETFDPLNIIKKMSFGSKFITAAAGKILKRSARDIEYFSGVKAPTSTRLRKVQDELDEISNEGQIKSVKLGKNAANVLEKIYTLMVDTKKLQQIKSNFDEENITEEKKDKDKKHKEIFESLQEIIKILKKFKPGQNEENNWNLPFTPTSPPKGKTEPKPKEKSIEKEIPKKLNRADNKKLANSGIKQDSSGKFRDKRGRFVSPKKVGEIIGSKSTKIPGMGKMGGGVAGMGAMYLAEKFSIPHLYKLYGQGKTMEQIESEEENMGFKEGFMDLAKTYGEMLGLRTASKIENNPITVKDKEETAMNYFQSPQGGGWTKEQAAGIVANLKAESNGDFSPNSVNPKSGAYGIAQWLGPRVDDFKRVIGRDLKGSSFLDQLKFVNWELHNTESRAGSLLRNSKDEKQAADIMMKYYERPSIKEQAQSIEKRRSSAEKLSQAGGVSINKLISPTPKSASVNSLVNENVSLKMNNESNGTSSPVIINKTNNIGGGNKSQVLSKSVARNDDPTLHQLQYHNLDRARV